MVDRTSNVGCVLPALPAGKALSKKGPTADWEEVPVKARTPDVKAGIVEEVAAMLNGEVRKYLPLFSLREAAAITRFAEDVLGYSTRRNQNPEQ